MFLYYLIWTLVKEFSTHAVVEIDSPQFIIFLVFKFAQFLIDIYNMILFTSLFLYFYKLK